MDHYLIVVDMQNDFVTGALGTKEAEAIVKNVEEKIRNHEGPVIFTKDTHTPYYLQTQEGEMLPVKHCIRDTQGWEIVPQLEGLISEKHAKVFEKETFGSTDLADYLLDREEEIESIELIGLCTDICVVSNALMIKAFLPEIRMYVDSSCCAGVTPQKHEAALETMRSCQIHIR